MMNKAINSALALAILAAIVLVDLQPAAARDRSRPDRREQVSKFDPQELLRLFKTKHPNRGREVISAPNGNTGINGSGLPKPNRKGKNRPRRAIPAPNGNTGINGTGLPQ